MNTLLPDRRSHNRPQPKARRRGRFGNFLPATVALLSVVPGVLAEEPEPAPVTAASSAAATPVQSHTYKKLSLEDLMAVQVTTVSRSESTVGQSPAAVFVITPEMLKRSGATTIPEALRMVPGVNVSKIDSSKWAVGVRGFGDRFSGKALVQVDGRTVYTPVNTGVYWDTVDYPLEDIERIEVIRGPGASVWGANAVNGIINIITKKAKDTQGGLIWGGGGTEEQGFAGLRYGGTLGEDLTYRVYGKWFDRDNGYNLLGNAQDNWRSGRTGMRLDWQPTLQDSITFQGDYFETVSGRRDLRPSPDFPTSFIVTNTEDEITKGGDVLARWSHETGPDSSYVLQTYYDRFHRRGTNGLFDFAVDTFDVDFQHQFPIGQRQKFIYGLGYRFQDILFLGSNSFDDAFSIGPDRVDVGRSVFSAFLQDEFEVVDDRLFFTLGSKFEHNDYTAFEVQPTARVLWTPTARQSVWASVSRAIRTPSVIEDNIEVSVLPIPTADGGTIFPRIFPDQGFESEVVIAYELGHRIQATKKLSIDTALFFNRYDKLSIVSPGTAGIDPATGVLTLPLERSNEMDGESYGAEVSLTWQPAPWWRIQAAYSYLKLNLHAQSQPSAEVIERQSPQNQCYLRSSFDLPGNVQFDVTGRFVDELTGFAPAIDSYIAMDMRLAWKPRENLEIALVAQNLFDSHHPEFGTSALIRSPLVESERGIYGMITWKF